MHDFLAKLQQEPLLLDGAMGTLLYARGVASGECLEALVLCDPGLIQAIHADYLAAGADVITTHTFGANAARLAHFGLSDQVRAINQRAVALARAACAVSTRRVWIAGNIGPLGRAIDWNEAAARADAAAIFAAQIDALAAGGVDLLLLETFSDVAEVEVVVEVARQRCALPIVASLSFGAQQQTLAGQSVEAAAARLLAAGVDVIGANCSAGPALMLATLAKLRQAAPSAFLSVAPNAGLPERDDAAQLRYPVGPAEFAAFVAEYLMRGARLAGGCCGTTPDYTAAMHQVVDNFVRG